MVSFEDRSPNMNANPLPAHGNSSVNMVDGCPGEFKVFDVRFIQRSLVQMHKDICLVSDCKHDHDGCVVCSINSGDDDVNVIVPIFKQLKRLVIQYDNNNSNNVSNRSVSPLVIRLAGPIPYSSDKVVPYQYNATLIEGGQEIPLPTTSSVVSIADVTKVTRSGRVFGPVFPKDKEESVVSKKVEVPVVDPVVVSKGKYGESSDLKANNDDEVLRLIKRKLPGEGRNHNLALHISMNCKRDALSNVLVDIGSSLNVLPKSTLSKLLYQGAHMRYSGVIVKAFDGSRKTVISEVDLPVKIGPSDFQITFQVMNIHPSYSCLLGRPWIHEAGAVTSTLHQKLKFVKNGKLVIVGGEKAPLVSHLSSFSYVEAEDEIVEEGDVDPWGRMVEVSDNKGRTGLGFQKGSSTARSEDMQLSFHSGRFIHGNEQHLYVVLKDDEEEDCTDFVTHGKACNNWTVVDVPVILHRSKLVPNSIEYNDPSPSPNFEFPVFEAEEESDVEVSDELTPLLEKDEKIIQSFEEQIELVNSGSEDDVKEVKIGSRLCPDVKKGLLLKPECPSVKQKLRRTHPDMAVKIKEEVQKQIDAGFLVTAEYPYNQIKMAPEDMEKTIFITPWGTFCYRVMPFGLKNAGATYQRAMTTLFHDMMHKEN
ncbi:hypothetical protein KIW84_056718 [Lathyrus oleraceus]|uniref:Uncharacterized protein n=1 Tax=Pisum sativum TaxID=3888 RepID=A0A9D4X1D2_PEA|nr:hypothetical protein KIW84_056718 [Pisum sativum]